MSMTPGDRIGPYEVLAPIGAGGMGEVFRARDTRLGREVALKSLPPHLSEEPDRLARFEREAKVLAALSHPNIAAIFGVEDSPSGRVLVLELAEGETLEERLRRGLPPLDEALAIARQIVEALESAHDKGIVHRDLKPANIKVAPDGKVKVLDFGLATAFFATGASDSGGQLSQSPTMSARMTGAGMLLGTAAYMSPEQARGKPVDKRADIWAFGAVLWELVTGRHLFEGETISDVLAAVLRQDVAWSNLPATTPKPLVRLLRRCLERDPHRRLRDIGEARLVIEEAGQPGSAAGEAWDPTDASARAAAPAARATLTRRLLPWLAVVLVAALAAPAGWLLRGDRDQSTRGTLRLSFNLPGAASLGGIDDRQTLALTRDGRSVVFRAEDGAVSRLFVRRLDEATAVPIPGTEGAGDLFLSPDGGWVAFVADGKLRKAPLHGGPVVTLCDVGQSRGGAWGPDGSIIFSPEVTSGLMRIPANGGHPAALTTPDIATGERSHRWPEFLPDGRSVLYTVGTLDKPGDYDDARLEIVEIESGTRHKVYDGASMGRATVSGHLLVTTRGIIYALPFDAGKLSVRGAPIPVLEGVAGDPSSGVAYFAVGDDGTLVYIAGGPTGRERDVVWIDRDGKTTPASLPPRQYRDVRISPDGTRLALSEGPGGGRQSNISIHDLVHETTLTLTSDGLAGNPVWSPDSQSVVYDHYGKHSIVRRPADGSGSEETLWVHTGNTITPSAISPDNSVVLLNRVFLPSKGDILSLPLQSPQRQGEAAVRPLLASQAHEVEAVFSPDGRLIAYTVVEQADPAIVVQSYPGAGGRWQVSTGPSVSARWPGDGRVLYYLTQDSLMAVPITSTAPFAYGRPERLIDLGKLQTAPRWGGSQYDVSPDGRRFVFILDRLREEGQHQVNVVLNWLDEVSRTVPLR